MHPIYTRLVSRFLLALIAWGLLATAQAQTPTWDAAWTAGGAGATWAFSTSSDAGGNVYVGGRFAGVNVAFGSFTLSNVPATGTGAANSNGYLAKYSASGTVLWARQASVAGTSSIGGVATDAAGNVYATGFFYGGALTLGSFTLPGLPTTTQAFVVKYDAQGTVQWARLLGSSSYATGNSVAVAAGGSLYVGGTFATSLTAGSLTPLSTPGFNDPDAFLLKLDATGTPVWARQLVGTGGFTPNDAGSAVALDAAGNPALAGYFYSATLVAGSATLANAAPGNADIFLTKFDAAGGFLWAQRAGGTDNDFGNGLTATANGNLYLAGLLGAAGGTVAGASIGANTNFGALVAGYSSAGAGLWAVREGNGSAYNGAATDPSGNLLAVGNMTGSLTMGIQAFTSAGGTDVLAARYTAAGILTGASRAGGQGEEIGYATCSDPTSSQTVVGYTQSQYIQLGTAYLQSQATQDALIIKYASTGALSFVTHITSNGGYDYAAPSATDAQGNVYITGTFGNNIRLDATTTLTSAQQTNDGFLVKYSPAGAVLWARQLLGGYANGLAVDGAGNVYITGNFYNSLTAGSTVLTSSGDADAFLLKYDTQGSLLWARNGGGSSYDEGYSVAVNASGIVAVVGSSQSANLTFGSQNTALGTTSYSPFLVRYDAAGTAQRVQAFPVQGTSKYGYSEAVALDAAGNAFVAGEFTGGIVFGGTTLTASGTAYTVFVAKVLATGSVQWARQSVGTTNALPYALATDPAGNLAVSGYMSGPTTFGSTTLTPVGSSGFFMNKYDPAGTLQWSRQSGGTGTSAGYGLAADAAGNFYLGGSYANGSPVFGTTTLPVAGTQPRALVVRYDAQGTPQWAVTPSASQSSYVRSVAVGPNGTLSVVGTYTNYLQFTIPLLLLGSEYQGSDIFVARLAGAVPLATRSLRPAALALACYPNPAHDAATVALPASAAPATLTLADALGREVRRYAVPAGATELHLTLRGLPAGLYLLRAGEATGKLVVE